MVSESRVSGVIFQSYFIKTSCMLLSAVNDTSDKWTIPVVKLINNKIARIDHKRTRHCSNWRQIFFLRHPLRRDVLYCTVRHWLPFRVTLTEKVIPAELSRYDAKTRGKFNHRRSLVLAFGWGAMASAVARAYNGGLGAVPPAGSRGRAPGQGVWGAKPPRSWTQLYIS